MKRWLALGLLLLGACTYPPAAEECTGEEEIVDPIPEAPLCASGVDPVWLPAGTCMLLRGRGLEEERQWDCSAILECSGAWHCVGTARVSWGDPTQCECDFQGSF